MSEEHEIQVRLLSSAQNCISICGGSSPACNALRSNAGRVVEFNLNAAVVQW